MDFVKSVPDQYNDIAISDPADTHQQQIFGLSQYSDYPNYSLYQNLHPCHNPLTPSPMEGRIMVVALRRAWDVVGRCGVR